MYRIETSCELISLWLHKTGPPCCWPDSRRISEINETSFSPAPLICKSIQSLILPTAILRYLNLLHLSYLTSITSRPRTHQRTTIGTTRKQLIDMIHSLPIDYDGEQEENFGASWTWHYDKSTQSQGDRKITSFLVQNNMTGCQECKS